MARDSGAALIRRPILDRQAWHPPELALVVGDERQAGGQRMGRDPEIVVADRLASAFERCADRAIGRSSRGRERLHRDEGHQPVERRQRPIGHGSLLHAETELPVADDRDHGLVRPKCLKAVKDGTWAALTNPDEDVGVEHVAQRHHSPLRTCGGLSSMVSRSVKAPSGSSHQALIASIKVRGFSRSTTSSPRRKISTSSLANRNSFGKRTAWLFPDLKTLAVVTFASVYTRRRYGRHRSQHAIRRLQLNGLRGQLTCWHTSDHSCATVIHGLRQSEPLHHPS